MTAAPTLDLVIPVYNEQRALWGAVTTLLAYMDSWEGAPSFRITIADNASTDATGHIAAELARRDQRVRCYTLSRKGRGHALKTVWSHSDAEVLVYMDVDLATDLSCLPPLVAPLLSGHSPIAIGTRLSPASRVVRGPKREFISRTYNMILKVAGRASFSDAQCGFKAITAEAFAALAPYLKDDEWFFDTELLLVADSLGLRIAEVPVDWVDDPDSSVAIAHTAAADLAGLARVMRDRALHAIPTESLRAALVRPLHLRGDVSAQRKFANQVVLFGIIGVLSTLLQMALYAACRLAAGPAVSTVISLVLSTFANTWANRTYTFGVRERAGAFTNHLQGLAITGATGVVQWAAALAVVAAGSGSATETIVVGVAGIAMGVLRFAAMKLWMFKEAKSA